MDQRDSLRSLGLHNSLLLSLQTPSTENLSTEAASGSSIPIVSNAVNTAVRGASDVLQSKALLEVLLSRNMAEQEHMELVQDSMIGIVKQQQQQQLCHKQQESTVDSLLSEFAATSRPALIKLRDEQPPRSPDEATNAHKQEASEDGEPVCVPCRARGMPADHNFKNAHFSIGNNIKHGEELVCSYPACRNGGVKFCYCAHCRIPVAKRNFRVRHHHFDSEPVLRSIGSEESGSLRAQEATSGFLPPGAASSFPGPSKKYFEAFASTDGEYRRNSHSPQLEKQSDELLLQFARHQQIQNHAIRTKVPEGLCLQAAGERASLPTDYDQSQVSKSESLAIFQITGLSNFVGQNASAPDSTCNPSVEPGTLTVPCRARGMPPDHKFDTAHFVVPQIIKHGDELICSYPACRNAGVKFCFCTHCRIPVAKRNFRIRHNHCDFAPPAVVSGQQVETPMHANSAPRYPPIDLHPEITKKDGKAMETESTNSANHSSDNERKRPVVSRRAVDAYGSATSSPYESEPSEHRVAVWDSLLSQRPAEDDTERMSTWLSSVLAVGNFDIPVTAEDTMAGSICNPSERAAQTSKKRSRRRPKKTQQNSKEVKWSRDSKEG